MFIYSFFVIESLFDHCYWNNWSTWQRASQHLSPEANVSLRPVLVPRLRIDPDVARHRGRVEDGQNRRLRVTVALENLHMRTQTSGQGCIGVTDETWWWDTLTAS